MGGFTHNHRRQYLPDIADFQGSEMGIGVSISSLYMHACRAIEHLAAKIVANRMQERKVRKPPEYGILSGIEMQVKIREERKIWKKIKFF